jgi:general secretion pathway protein G
MAYPEILGMLVKNHCYTFFTTQLFGFNMRTCNAGRRLGGMRQRGFTLIEIMVVVIILSILAVFVVPQIMERPDDARILKARQDIQALEAALNLYRLDNYSYPTTDQGLDALTTKPSSPPEPRNWKTGGYIKKLETDPWGNPYRYLSPGQFGEFDLYSLGADNQQGGEGKNADITSWNLPQQP